MKISLSSYALDLTAHAFHITLLIASPLIAPKYFVLFGVPASCAILTVPFPLLIICYLTQKYGSVYGNKMRWQGIGGYLLMVVCIWGIDLIPMDVHSVVSESLWSQVLGRFPSVAICWGAMYVIAGNLVGWCYEKRLFQWEEVSVMISVWWGTLVAGSLWVMGLVYTEVISLPLAVWIGSMGGFSIWMLIIGSVFFLIRGTTQKNWLKNRIAITPSPILYGLYPFLLMCFWLVLLLTNLVVVKCFSLWGYFFTVGLLTYPFTFLGTDLVGELYGKKKAIYAVWSGFLVSVIMMMVLVIVDWMPIYHTSIFSQQAFSSIFSFTPAIVVASMLAYLASQFTDVYLFDGLRLLTHGKYLWLRNNAATMISQLIDTFIFAVIVWYIWPKLHMASSEIDMGNEYWCQLAINEYMGKLVLALLDTPLVYVGTRWFQNYK
ncbi:MAG: queuosine precursor transporter [Bacteroidota bacterium]